jgi:hypothetical protein
MTPYLIAICWVTLTLTPTELVFDWLEDESNAAHDRSLHR